MPIKSESELKQSTGWVGNLRSIPRGIWALGFVSMFMDISSEMIHSLLPVFIVSVLGASAVSLGIIEGVAEATASISRVFSGVVSDFIGRRKLLVAIGYGLGAISKPFFALANSIGWVFAARFSDRIGKGIRGAPRDALVAEIAPQRLWGASYGLRQALDTFGALLGPLLALVLMALSGGDFRMVFWLAVIPALISVVIIIFAVKDPKRVHGLKEARPPIRFQAIRLLKPPYWLMVGVGAVVTMARFSEAFLVLRAQQLGLATALIPLVLIAMNFSYTLCAYPAGHLSDILSRRSMLAVSLVLLIVADLFLALSGNIALVLLGVVFWGLHMAFSQGVLAALVADTTPASLRGTGFGVFNLASGVVMIAASVVAGLVWENVGPAFTFYVGAGFSALALLSTVAIRQRRVDL